MQPDDPKISDLTLSSAIRLLRELAALGVLSYLSVKLFSGELSMDFTKLSATELVNLLLAFFSIALSAAFYFAATSQSNQFYDNVNKFSKDTSELLGRLDEQVKGLGGRQSELKESIDKYYFKGHGRGAEQAEQDVQARAKQVEENLSKLVSDLLDKANLPAGEKSRIQEELRAKDAELGELRERLGRLSSGRENAVRRYTARKIEQFGTEKALALPLEDWAIPVIQLGVSGYRRDLKALGYATKVDPESIADITDQGRKMLQAALEVAVELHKEA